MGAFFCLRHGGLDRNSHLQFYCLVAMILGNGDAIYVLSFKLTHPA